MNKTIMFLVSFVFFPGIVKSMDDVADKKKPADVRIDMQGNNPNPRLSLKLPADAGSRRFMKSSGGSGGSSASGKSGKSTVRCHDDLSGQLKAQRASSVPVLKKKTIVSRKPLSKKELVDASDGDDELSIEVVDPATKKRSMLLPKKVAEHIVGGSLSVPNQPEEKFYPESAVWEGLKIVDQKLYNLGKSYNMTLEDVVLYRSVLENNDLDHDYVMGAIKERLGDRGAVTAPLTIWSAIGNLFTIGSNNQNQEATINPAWSAMYQDIKSKDPKSYELVLFEIMKELESGQRNSAITDLHTNLQNKGIQQTNESLTKSVLVNLIAVFTTLAPIAWGIYGQISSTSSVSGNCTG